MTWKFPALVVHPALISQICKWDINTCHGWDWETRNHNFANKKISKTSSLVRSQWDLCPDKEENAVLWGPQREDFLLEMKRHGLRLNRKVLWDFLVLPWTTGYQKALWDLACYKLSQAWSLFFWFCCFFQNDQELRFLLQLKYLQMFILFASSSWCPQCGQ